MKSVLVIIDGVSDEPIEQLGRRTPLEVAYAPHVHYIASRGQVGRIATTFPGYPIESMVCIMGLLGYPPEQFYPTGRASFEALAKGIPLQPNDLVLRCNTITVDPGTDRLADFTAGLISDSDARKLISQVSLPHPNWELYPGQSYRNILIIRGANVAASTLKCFEPHMNIGKAVEDALVAAKDSSAQDFVAELNRFLLDTRRQIEGMQLPASCRANMLWVWSPSVKPVWPSFRSRTGVDAAVVGGLDFLHGIAMAARIHFDIIPGATGYIDTDYAAKARYALQYLEDYDFVLVHVNAADEEAHQHNHAGKIEAVEKTDCLIVGPLLQALHSRYPGDFRIAVCGDHMTRCHDGKHADDPVPYAVYGRGVPASGTIDFSERRCQADTPMPSIEFFRTIMQARAA